VHNAAENLLLTLLHAAVAAADDDDDCDDARLKFKDATFMQLRKFWERENRNIMCINLLVAHRIYNTIFVRKFSIV